MARVVVDLPDDLHRLRKERELPASELLQQAIRAEVRRRDLLDASDTYLRELTEEVGAPSADELALAERVALGLKRRGRPAS